MKKYIILIYIAFVLVTACTSSEPKDVLKRQEMASMLIEMYIKEAEINELGLRTDSASILHQVMLQQVLEKKGISEETYLKSYDYYISNLKRFDEVYAIVIDSLKLRETIAQQQDIATREILAKMDSLTVKIDSLSTEDSLALFAMGPKWWVDSSLYLFPFDSLPPIKFDTITSSRLDSLPPLTSDSLFIDSIKSNALPEKYRRENRF